MSRSLDDLLEDHFDGELDDSGRGELAKLLQTPEARSRLVQRAHFESLLRRTCAKSSSTHRSKKSWMMPVGLAAAAVLMIATAVLWFGGHAADTDSLEVVSGSVTTTDGTPTTRITPGNSVVVEGKEAAVLRLSDGSTSSLSPGTTAMYTAADTDSRGTIEIGPGQGNFDIHPHAKPLTVVTTLGRISTTSSRFTVDHDDKDLGMDVSVKTGRVEVLGEQTTLVMQAGEQHLFSNSATALRRNGKLIATDGRRISLSFGGTPERIVRDYPVTDTARILIDGQPTLLTSIPIGTKVYFLGTKQAGITEVAAMGAEVTARVVAIDSSRGHVSLLLSADGRKMDLPCEQIEAPMSLIELKLLLRVRLSMDGQKAISARLLPGCGSPEKKPRGTKRSTKSDILTP